MELIVLFPVLIIAAIIIGRDASSRGMSGLVWGLATFFFFIITILIYIAVRSPKLSTPTNIQRNFFPGDASLESANYKEFLIEKYSIRKSSELGTFIYNDKEYNEIDEALSDADERYKAEADGIFEVPRDMELVETYKGVEIYKSHEMFWVNGKQTKDLDTARAIALAVSRQNKN
jgi:hypothetical protein